VANRSEVRHLGRNQIAETERERPFDPSIQPTLFRPIQGTNRFDTLGGLEPIQQPSDLAGPNRTLRDPPLQLVRCAGTFSPTHDDIPNAPLGESEYRTHAGGAFSDE